MFSSCRFFLTPTLSQTADQHPVKVQDYRVGQKTGPFLKVYMTPVYDEVGRQSVYQNVELLSGVNLIFGMSP